MAPRPTRAVRARLLISAFVATASVLAACGSSPGDGEAQARARIVRQLHLTPKQASCLWPYLDRRLTPGEIERIARDGFTAGTTVEWGYYTRAVLTCVLYHDLVGGDRNPSPSG